MKTILFIASVVMSLLLPAPVLGQQTRVRILIAYHSETGNTKKLAEAIRAGADSVEGVEVKLRAVAEVESEEILRSDGIIAGGPVRWSNVSVETKQFLDRVGAELESQVERRRPDGGRLLHGWGNRPGQRCHPAIDSHGLPDDAIPDCRRRGFRRLRDAWT